MQSFSPGGSGVEHNINQFQYLGWSEFEAPSSMSSIFLLIKEIRKIVESKGKDINILVHCSTGSGRSGTFIALYYLMELLDQKMSNIQQAQENPVNKKLKDHDLEIDVFNSVSNLMKERCELVSICLKQYANYIICMKRFDLRLNSLFKYKSTFKIYYFFTDPIL